MIFPIRQSSGECRLTTTVENASKDRLDTCYMHSSSFKLMLLNWADDVRSRLSVMLTMLDANNVMLRCSGWLSA